MECGRVPSIRPGAKTQSQLEVSEPQREPLLRLPFFLRALNSSDSGERPRSLSFPWLGFVRSGMTVKRVTLSPLVQHYRLSSSYLKHLADRCRPRVRLWFVLVNTVAIGRCDDVAQDGSAGQLNPDGGKLDANQNSANHYCDSPVAGRSRSCMLKTERRKRYLLQGQCSRKLSSKPI